MKKKCFVVLAMMMLIMGMACSCGDGDKLTPAVEQAAATLPKSLDSDGITKWTSVAYDKEANVVTFEYTYDSEYVTEEAFDASDADMKAALMQYLLQDQVFVKAMEDASPKIRYVLGLSGMDKKKTVEFAYDELFQK